MAHRDDSGGHEKLTFFVDCASKGKEIRKGKKLGFFF